MSDSETPPAGQPYVMPPITSIDAPVDALDAEPSRAEPLPLVEPLPQPAGQDSVTLDKDAPRTPRTASSHGARESGPPDDPPGRKMVCPYCLSEFDWDTAPLVNLDAEGDETALRREPGESDVRWRNRTMHAWRVCEKTRGDDHFIPASIGAMTTLIVGMVGKSNSGKSHLLWAMMTELGESALKISHRLDVLPLDPRLQRELYDRNQFGLLNHRKVLNHTLATDRAEFACAYRIHSGHTGEDYALLIFDVAGEIFTRGMTAEATPFMAIADGLIFVADGAALDVRQGRSTGDPGFTEVLSHLAHIHPKRSGGFLPIPAATVVAKSDLLRKFKEVDQWIDRKDDLELHTIERESEDAYAFLASRGARSWLVPVQECADSTLHFASATGVEAQNGEYPENSFRRLRVLRPLLSLLAMKGVLPRESLGIGAEES